jgi:nucleotide-binding universal stress UspA family protein
VGPAEPDTLVIREILVGTEGLAEDERALAALCGALDGQRVKLRIVHVLTVPMTAPLDVAMPDAERQAAQLLERSGKIAERFAMPAETAVLRGREVGTCLVEEALRCGADAVCVRFRSRPAPLGHFVVSATVSTLLSSSPCPVITLHFPHR